jgi:hypothetical protein
MTSASLRCIIDELLLEGGAGINRLGKRRCFLITRGKWPENFVKYCKELMLVSYTLAKVQVYCTVQKKTSEVTRG